MKKPSDIVEEIEAMGQDSEVKAAKWVKEKGKEEEKLQNEKDAVALTKLHDKRKQVITYRDVLLKEARIRLQDYDIPIGYIMDIAKTDKGVLFGFRHLKQKKWFMKGMKVSGLPREDLFGISMMINWALDSIAQREEENGTRNDPAKKIIS